MEQQSEEKTKQKKKLIDWLKDYVLNDISPAENYFEIVSQRRPYLRRWQWYISVCLQLLLFGTFIFAMVWASGQCLSVGFEELNKSCDQCLARCNTMNKSSIFFGETNMITATTMPT
jgi:hypothetical protein